MDNQLWISVTFKFGGFWTFVKNEGRRKYEGGRQKTIKVDKVGLSFTMLIEEIERICPWIRGQCYEFHYHVRGTSPKEYELLTSNLDGFEMISQSTEGGQAEIVVTLQDVSEIEQRADTRKLIDCDQMVDSFHSNFDNAGNCGNELETYIVGPSDSQAVEAKALFVGARFDDCLSFKQHLRTKAIIENFGIKIKASDKTRVIATCSHRGCTWRVRASLCADGQTFEVRKLDDSHICPGINRAGNRQATTTWVANQIQNLVKKQPDISPKQIKNNLETLYGLSLPYMKLWRSIELARESIFGTVDGNYRWVPTLRAELINRNPGSHITFEYDSKDNSFRRFFVSFKVCIDGFLVGCRHLIGLDACHLKSKYLGVLLSANSLDGNNGLFTIAFAVVESESKGTWKWFLENLAEAFGCQVVPLAFISDMEKGLGEAIRAVFSETEHRVCLRHLWKNIKKNHHSYESQKVQSTVWSAANALTRIEFNAKLAQLLNMSPSLHSYLLKLPYKWSKCEFLPEIKNHYNTNNMSESFNSWINEARDKPVVDLIDFVRGMLMEQRAERKLSSSRWRGELVPYVDEYIRDITTRKDHFIIRQSTSCKAEVEGHFERHEVDIEQRECSCRYWQLTGLPCIHVVAFIGTKEYPLWHTYIDDYFHVFRYKMAYEGAIATLPGKDQWSIPANEPHLGVPKTLRPRGRPKKRRIKSFLENTTKKVTRVHKCSRCGSWGHHRSTCKNPLNASSSTLPDG